MTADNNIETFWVVYVTEIGRLSNKFATKSEAINFIKRIAKNNISCKFYVFQARTICSVEDQHVIVTELEDRKEREND